MFLSFICGTHCSFQNNFSTFCFIFILPETPNIFGHLAYFKQPSETLAFCRNTVQSRRPWLIVASHLQNAVRRRIIRNCPSEFYFFSGLCWIWEFGVGYAMLSGCMAPKDVYSRIGSMQECRKCSKRCRLLWMYYTRLTMPRLAAF